MGKVHRVWKRSYGKSRWFAQCFRVSTSIAAKFQQWTQKKIIEIPYLIILYIFIEINKSIFAFLSFDCLAFGLLTSSCTSLWSALLCKVKLLLSNWIRQVRAYWHHYGSWLLKCHLENVLVLCVHTVCAKVKIHFNKYLIKIKIIVVN